MRAGTLTHEQARYFRNQGYYRLPEVFTPDETGEMREFVRSEIGKDPNRAKRLGGPAVKLYGLYGRNPELVGKFVRNAVLVGTLQSILGPNVVFVANRHNHATVNDQQG